MLEELEVRNLGPIHHARFTPASGMTAITGETGAGKSMLLNALGLISGAPTQAARVSPGQDSSWAQGVFELVDSSPIPKTIEETGIEPEDGQLFLTRSVPAEGRSKSLINGHTVPRSLLHELSNQLITIHGQADQLRMAAPGKQRDFLDTFAADSAELNDYRDAWQRLQEVDHKLAVLQDQQASIMQQSDYLRQSVERIDQVDPHPGEDVELRDQRDRIEHATQILQGITGALAALDASQLDGEADSPSATELIEQALQSLQGITINSLFEDAIDRLHSIATDLSDVVFNLTQQIDIESDAADLDKINDRIHELDTIKGHWGPTLEDVLKWREQAAYDLEDMDASPERVKALEEEQQQARQEALLTGRKLSNKRKLAAVALSKAVNAELKSLAMDGSRLDVLVSQRSDQYLNAHGLDDVSFLFTPFPGSPQLPMGSSASGGELSRLMLAMELVAAQSAKQETQVRSRDRMTFIFDEVDAGVGGKTAVELGRRLARLSQDAQVIVVTHLPQVASWADRQFVVAKKVEQGSTQTSVDEVSGASREKEIARMLAGSESTTSLRHARELLESSKNK